MTGKKPKIALCLSGEPRNTMVSFPYLFESFLNPRLGYDIDVFIYTSKPYRTIDLYSPINLKIEEDDDYQICDNFFDNNLNGLDYHQTPFRNTFLMYYGIQQVFNLTQNQQYDFYIRCRPDIIFHNPLNLQYIINSLTYNNKDIFTPQIYEKPDWNNEVNDQLAICNFKSFKVYSSIVDNLLDLVSQTKSFYPENLLAKAFSNNNIKIERGIVNYSLIRKNIMTTFPQRPFITFD